MKPEKPTYEDFYSGNYMRVLGHLCKKVDNRSDAEDLAQEIFTYCYKSYDKFDPEKSAATTWLFVITQDRLKNYYRDKKEYADWELVEAYAQFDCNDLEKSVYIQEIRAALAGALEKLPERQRQVVVYKFFCGKNHREIADLLEISENNSRVILNRALKELEKHMKKYMN